MINEGILNFNAFLAGISLGLAFGVLELFILAGLRKSLSKLPLPLAILTKAILYLAIIILVSGSLTLIVGFFEGKNMEEFYVVMRSKEQIIMVLYTLMLFILMSFYIQINLLIGDGVLWKFLLGRYRKPVGEQRIFMFLDIKSSTSLAERLGLEKYYSLLNDFFQEISHPAQKTNAEIYQYIGDEVVFTWETKEGVDNSNCLKIFFKIKEKIYDRRKYYREKYGGIPEFKAGLHYGEVISAQIGDIKREIIYNGDVLNTSARIQEQCNKLNRKLLISGTLLEKLDIRNEYNAEKIDTIKLRGKEHAVELYSLTEF